jgi:uncharacterized DUF497 family protein
MAGDSISREGAWAGIGSWSEAKKVAWYANIVYTIILMELDYDPVKRERTLRERGLDFARCNEVFSGPCLEMEDARFDYEESRFITYGFLDGREVVIVWTPRGPVRRIIFYEKSQ